MLSAKQIGRLITGSAIFFVGVVGLCIDLYFSYNPGIGCSTDVGLGVGTVSAGIAAYGIYLCQRAVKEETWTFGPFDLVFTVLFAVMNGFLTYWHVQTSESNCNPYLFRFGWIWVPVWVEVGAALFYIGVAEFCWPRLKKEIA